MSMQWRFVAVLLAMATFAVMSATRAVAGTRPYQAAADTITDAAFTVSWVTTTSESGYVKFGTSADALTSRADDVRGATASGYTHCVVVSGLSADTTYYWKICSGGVDHGDETGQPFRTTTHGSLILIGSRFVTGQVVDDSGTAVAGAIVRVSVRDTDASGSSGESQVQTTLSDSSGGWVFVLESFRTANGAAGFSTAISGDTIVVSADGGDAGVGGKSVDSSYASSAPSSIETQLVAPAVPVVATVSPSTGTNTVGTNVTLGGTGFLFASGAKLGDGGATALTNFNVVSDSQITATVPAGVAVGTHSVLVTSVAGTNSSSAQSFTSAAAPVIADGVLSGWTSVTAYSRTLAVTGGSPPLAWTVVSGATPAGLTLASNGILSGTPTAAGTSSFRVRVTDNSGVTAEKDLSITIAEAVTSPAGTLVDWTVNRPYGSAELSTTGGTDPVAWTFTGLPAGLVVSGTGRTRTVSGTPTASGSHSTVVTVTDSVGSTASRTYAIYVNPPIAAPTGSLPDWTVDRAYGARTLTTSGGTDFVTWVVTGLPPGLTGTANARTFTVTGTPTTAGSYSVTATPSDAAGSSASTSFTIRVNAPLTQPDGTLQDWTSGQAYGNRQVTTTGGTDPIVWSASGVPAGLTASGNARTLTLSGTPTSVGTQSIVLTATDATGATTSRTFVMTIHAPVSTPAGTLPEWTVGRPYGPHEITTSGGTDPVTWTITGLPPGTSASSSGRSLTVSGTPMQAAAVSVEVTATDAAGSSASRTFSLTVNPAVAAPAGSLPEWTQGRDYGTQSITTTGGTGAITWTVTGLPAGMLATTSDRTLRVMGTPSAAGTFSVVATATDTAGSSASTTWSLIVNAPVATPTGVLPAWTLGRPYGARSLSTAGGTDPVTWDVSGLPAGLSGTASGRTFAVSGTPALAGTFTVTATATDAVGSFATRELTLVVNPPLTTPTGTLPNWTAGRDWGIRVVSTTGGTDDVTWAADGLPTGLVLTGAGRTCTVTGAPGVAGTFRVTLTATDAAGSTAATDFEFVVNPALTPPAGSLPEWTAGQPYVARMLTTTGGTEPLEWSVSGLPSGMTVTPSGRTASIGGTPAAAGTYSVVATVADPTGSIATRALTLVIHPPVTAPAGSLPEWTVGRDYGTRTLTTTGGTDPIAWTATGLPPGLAAVANGRSLSIVGVPTTAGMFTVQASVSDLPGSVASRAFIVTINPPVTAPTGELSDWTQGRDYGSRQLGTTDGTGPFSWTVAGLPPGLAFAANGRALSVFGTPNETGTYAVTATVTDVAGSTASTGWAVVINGPLSSPTGSLPNWTVGQNYGNRVLATTGGTDPVTWSLIGFPPGLSATGSGRTCTVSGTPTSADSFTVVATATDRAGSTVSRTFTVVIAAPVTEPAGALPAWTVNRDYGARVFVTTGGTDPLQWSVVNLPDGLSWLASGRLLLITGTPTRPGAYAVQVTVTDAAGSSATRPQTVTINDALGSPTGSIASAWTSGQPVEPSTLRVAGGTLPVTWNVSLPPGLQGTASGRDYQVSGVPTTAGMHVVVATVTDGSGAVANASWPFEVNAALGEVTGALPAWTVGRPYPPQRLGITGGTESITWQVTGLPAGISDVANGRELVLSGTPGTPGPRDVLVVATDAAGARKSRTLPWTLNDAVSIATAELGAWTVGQPDYRQDLAVQGGTGPFTWQIVSGVPGLSLDQGGSSPAYIGKPTQVGSFGLELIVTDVAGSTARRSYTMVVNPALRFDAQQDLPFAATATDYAYRLWADGTGPFAVTPTGDLPSGLRIDAVTGELVGTPEVAGPHEFSVNVVDVAGAIAQRAFRLDVAALVDVERGESQTFRVPDGRSDVLVAFRGLRRSKLSLTLPRSEQDPRALRATLLDVDGSAYGEDTVPRQVRPKATRTAVRFDLSPLRTTGLHFLRFTGVVGGAPAGFEWSLSSKVTYGSFSGRVTVHPGLMPQAVTFAAPPGATLTAKLTAPGRAWRATTEIRRVYHEDWGDEILVSPGDFVSRWTLPSRWGEYAIDLWNGGAEPMELRYAITVRRP